MTIVATNNITVSNVNDGTITHTAYAYSADGMEGFYVGGGTNLLTNTGDLNANWSGITSISTTAGYNGHPSMVFTFSSDRQLAYQRLSLGTLKNSTQYTASFWAKADNVGDKARTEIWGSIGATDFVLTTNWVRYTAVVTSYSDANTNISHSSCYFGVPAGNKGTVYIAEPKLELGTTATPWSPAPSEAHPSYIGQYTDFNTTASTDPAKYAPWIIFKGNDGVGVISTDITYAMSTSGTTAPSTGWTSSVPTLVKGQYLWTKTVWTYTDTSSKTAYSVTYISKDGTNGTNGTSGIIVSSVAPTSPQTGQLWQDTSTTPQLVKKWTGTSWVIWAFYAQNLIADNISTISLNLGDMTGGTVKLMADVDVNGALKKHGLYQSKLGLLSSGPSLSTPSTLSNTQMGVANLNKGELRFIVTDYTDDLKNVQETGMSDPNTAFIQFNSYDDGRDELTISSSGDIFMSGQVSQTEQWQTIAPGVVCKRSFGMISLWYSVTPTVSGDFQMGTIPADMRPQFALMFYAPVFQSTMANDRKIQVNAGGSVILLNAVASGNYRGNLSFTV